MFQSLKEHYARNTYNGLSFFREYLLFVYIHTVPIRVHGQKYHPMSTLFGYKPFYKWSDEEMFIACLGLSFQNVSGYTLRKYKSIIERFGISERELLRIANDLSYGETKVLVNC